MNDNLETDWCLVWEDKYTNKIDDNFSIFSEYKIFYSKIRNEYFLRMIGFKPKLQAKYQTALEKINEFIKNGHDSEN